jgi:hypothetical protein
MAALFGASEFGLAPLSRRGAYCGPLEASMLDVVFLAISGGFFAAAILYAYACDRL